MWQKVPHACLWGRVRGEDVAHGPVIGKEELIPIIQCWSLWPRIEQGPSRKIS